MSSVNRDLAKSMGAANSAGTLTSTGEVSGAAGMTVVTTADSLPTSANAGDRAFVDSSNRYYIHSGSGWYNIALINTNPSFTSILDSGGDSVTSAAFALSDEGLDTVITITAADPEGVPITYTATTGGGFDSMATVSQNGQVFTITPFSPDSAVTSSGTITFKASDGINVATALRTFTLTFSAPANTGRNALLLKADNSAPTAPTDESSNNLSITTSGTQAEAFSGSHPFGLGSSYYFNGTSSRVTCSNNRFDIGTGDFTWEGWLQHRGDSGIIIHNAYWNGGNNRGWYLDTNTGGSLRLRASQGSWNSWPTIFSLGGFFPLGVWTHFSVNRSNGTIKIYRNGALYYSMSYSSSLNQTGGSSGNRASVIGARYSDNAYKNYLLVYLRDIVIDTGTAIRTADFTPPAGLTAVDDQITLSSSCKAYLFKGNNESSNIDHGPNGNSYTFTSVYGSATAPPAGDYYNWTSSTKGGSYFFDGTTSPYFSVNQNTELALGTSDWTIEFWFKPKVLSKAMVILDARSADTENSIYIGYHANNFLQLYVNGATRMQSTIAWRQNVWYHVMFTKSSAGNGTRMFVNGYYQGHWQDTTNYVNNGPWYIGQRYASRSSSNACHGYVKDFRVKNVASASTNDNIAVPTEKLTADSDTILLVAGNTTGKIFDVVGGLNDIRANMAQGDTTASTVQTKYADASMYFDGTGDYLSVPDGTNLDFSNSATGGAASYTLETWVYPTTLSGSSTWRTICNNGTSGNYAPMYLTMLGDKLHYLASHNETSYVMDTRTDLGSDGIHTMSANTWQHVAVTWNNNRYSFFVDGVHKATRYKSGSYPMDPNYDLGVGARDDGNEPFTGYLEDFRITKGLSRYPFVPHNTTHVSDSNTLLLTGHAATITDGSSNSRTVTSTGDPAVSNVSPHPNMKSIDFDGTGDYLTVDFGSSPIASSSVFTIEAWIWPRTISNHGLFHWTDSQGTLDATLYISTDGHLSFYDGGDVTANDGNSIIANAWNHIVMTRESDNYIRLILNGTPHRTSTNTYTPALARYLELGRYGSQATPFNGYMSNIRFSDNVRYTYNFTPPTEALTG